MPAFMTVSNAVLALTGSELGRVMVSALLGMWKKLNSRKPHFFLQGLNKQDKKDKRKVLSYQQKVLEYLYPLWFMGTHGWP